LKEGVSRVSGKWRIRSKVSHKKKMACHIPKEERAIQTSFKNHGNEEHRYCK